MTMTLRERLARKLYNLAGYDASSRGEDGFEGNRDAWLSDADAILAEMREPTEAMIARGEWAFPSIWAYGAFTEPSDVRYLWEEMISAALAEKDG